jgi:transmembrane sensor
LRVKPTSISETVREQAVAWLLRRETLSDRERAAFDAWLAEDPRHRLAFEQVSGQWDWLEQFKHTPVPAREAASRYRAPRRPIRHYASAAVLLLAIGLAAISADGWPGLVRTYSTMKGETKTLTLPDGSRLELNTDTEVRVHFNHFRRHVDLLRGESFFIVKHDPDRPFEVAAGSGAIRDIGTAFNVWES